MKGKIKESQLRTHPQDIFDALSLALRKAGKSQSIYALAAIQRIHEDEWKQVCEYMIDELRIF